MPFKALQLAPRPHSSSRAAVKDPPGWGSQRCNKAQDVCHLFLVNQTLSVSGLPLPALQQISGPIEKRTLQPPPADCQVCEISWQCFLQCWSLA